MSGEQAAKCPLSGTGWITDAPGNGGRGGADDESGRNSRFGKREVMWRGRENLV